LTEDIVRNFLVTYNFICRIYQIPLSLRFNLDETWLDETPDNHKSVGYKSGPKPLVPAPPSVAEHVTLVPIINAEGDDFTPTAILPLKTVPALCSKVKKYFNLAGSNDGWMTSEILKNVVEGVFLQQLQQHKQENGLEGKKALLVLDNHSSRVSMDEERLFREHDLIIIYIPPHSSALLQPLDLCPNSVFKKEYYKWKPETAGMNRPQQRNAELQAARMALSSALSLGNVAAGWSRAGLISKTKDENGVVLADVEAVLRSKMIQIPLDPLPPVVGKKKRGPAFDTGGLWVNDENMLNLNPPSAPKEKKQRKMHSAAVIVIDP
jgi:hypothetical protein